MAYIAVIEALDNDKRPHLAGGNGELMATAGELAAVLNLAVQRVNQLAVEGIIEKTRHGHARLEPSIRRYINYCVEPIFDLPQQLRNQAGDLIVNLKTRE